MRKPVFGVSDLVQHKPGCTATEECLRLENFLILEVEELHYLCSEKQGTDKLHGYHAADLHLCFCKCKSQVFS